MFLILDFLLIIIIMWLPDADEREDLFCLFKTRVVIKADFPA